MRTGWPYQQQPTGWFQVGWSPELPVGGVVPLRCFGSDLVAFRDEAGEVHVLDAFCPHLGAHLGYGGVVEGLDIVCPFHGWRWSGDGRNVCIPYSRTVNRAQRIPTWPVVEVDGMILLWHGPDGCPPMWSAPTIESFAPEFDVNECHPADLHRWPAVQAHPQFVIENAVDLAHFAYVHSARCPSTITSYHENGPFFDVEHVFESQRGSRLRMRAYGMGLMLGVFYEHERVTLVNIQGLTPVEERLCDIRATVWVSRQAVTSADQAKLLAENQYAEFDKDIPIWEHMRYVDTPPLVPEEARPYSALRRWARQFYTVDDLQAVRSGV